MRQNRTRAANIDARERERRALELRRAGFSYEEIGQKLGCGSSTAHRDVTSYLDRVAEETAESARELVRLELERLDALQAAVWDQAMAGHLGAIDRALRVGERRAKLLGLDSAAAAMANQAPVPPEVDVEAILLKIDDGIGLEQLRRDRDKETAATV